MIKWQKLLYAGYIRNAMYKNRFNGIWVFCYTCWKLNLNGLDNRFDGFRFNKMLSNCNCQWWLLSMWNYMTDITELFTIDRVRVNNITVKSGRCVPLMFVSSRFSRPAYIQKICIPAQCVIISQHLLMHLSVSHWQCEGLSLSHSWQQKHI